MDISRKESGDHPKDTHSQDETKRSAPYEIVSLLPWRLSLADRIPPDHRESRQSLREIIRGSQDGENTSTRHTITGGGNDDKRSCINGHHHNYSCLQQPPEKGRKDGKIPRRPQVYPVRDSRHVREARCIRKHNHWSPNRRRVCLPQRPPPLPLNLRFYGTVVPQPSYCAARLTYIVLFCSVLIFIIVMSVLFFLHRRRQRLDKAELANDPHELSDYGLDEIPATKKGASSNNLSPPVAQQKRLSAQELLDAQNPFGYGAELADSDRVSVSTGRKNSPPRYPDAAAKM